VHRYDVVAPVLESPRNAKIFLRALYLGDGSFFDGRGQGRIHEGIGMVAT
jgi:hypothetical protein